MYICTFVFLYICRHVYIYVYAFGPKTVLLKSMFLGFPTNLVFDPPARVGWGGVGWDEIWFVVCVLLVATCNMQHSATVLLVTCNKLLMQRCYRLTPLYMDAYHIIFSEMLSAPTCACQMASTLNSKQ